MDDYDFEKEMNYEQLSELEIKFNKTFKNIPDNLQVYIPV